MTHFHPRTIALVRSEEVNSSEIPFVRPMIQKQLLNKLKDFGLNTYEARLWIALLSRGVSTAGELSDIANVPRSRSYDVLESLEKKGFIIMKIGKPIKYLAVPPEEVVERVKKNITSKAQVEADILDGLKKSEVLDELNTLHTTGVELIDPSDITGSFRGRASIYNHLEMLIKGAETSISILTSENDLIFKADRLMDVIQKAVGRGVTVRIAAPLTDKNKHAHRAFREHVEVRNMVDLKSRFYIIDNKEVVFMLFDDEKVHTSYDSGVWANTPFFATTLQSMFDNEWTKLKPTNIST